MFLRNKFVLRTVSVIKSGFGRQIPKNQDFSSAPSSALAESNQLMFISFRNPCVLETGGRLEIGSGGQRHPGRKNKLISSSCLLPVLIWGRWRRLSKPRGTCGFVSGLQSRSEPSPRPVRDTSQLSGYLWLAAVGLRAVFVSSSNCIMYHVFGLCCFCRMGSCRRFFIINIILSSCFIRRHRRAPGRAAHVVTQNKYMKYTLNEKT